MAHLGIQVRIRLLTDATTAKAISAWRGRGKIRHLDAARLWLRQMVNDGILEEVKIKNDFNSAELFTKHLDRTTMDKCLDLLGHEFTTGRSSVAPKRNFLHRSVCAVVLKLRALSCPRESADNEYLSMIGQILPLASNAGSLTRSSEDNGKNRIHLMRTSMVHPCAGEIPRAVTTHEGTLAGQNGF